MIAALCLSLLIGQADTKTRETYRCIFGLDGGCEAFHRMVATDPDGGYRVVLHVDSVDRLVTKSEPQPPQRMRFLSTDGGVISMTTDEVYELVNWGIAAKKREEENGACVPDWTEWPYYSPACAFIRPTGGKR